MNKNITQRCVFNVDPIPKVLISGRGFKTSEGGNGAFLHELNFRLPFADGMTVRVCGEGVVSALARASGPTTVVEGAEFSRDSAGCRIEHYPAVVGKWVLDVATANANDRFSAKIVPD